MYLDISYTQPHDLLSLRFHNLDLHSLAILKLRGLRLTDSRLKTLLESNYQNLWSLDLRDNLLTDKSTERVISYMLRRRASPASLDWGEKWQLYEFPPGQTRDERLELTLIRADDLSFIKYFSDDLEQEREDSPIFKKTGLTQLYISENKFTSTGIERIIAHSDRLQIFDAGMVRYTELKSHILSNITLYFTRGIGTLLGRFTSPHLSNVRIHHSVVTNTPSLCNHEGNQYSPDHLATAEAIGLDIEETKLGQSQRFDPLTNFNIHTLTLTGIPNKSYGPIIERLKMFLVACHEQERILESARASVKNHRRAPPLLQGLRCLNLEFIKPSAGQVATLSSISGDADAETFNKASEGDFSFFSTPSSEPPHTSTAVAKATAKADAKARELQIAVSRLRSWNYSRKGSEDKGKGKDKETVEQEDEPVIYDVFEEIRKFRAKTDVRWSGKVQIYSC